MLANLNRAGAEMQSKRGKFHSYEILLKASSSNSAADGEFHCWIDGVKTHEYKNVKFQMQASRKWMSLAWNPTYGGGLHPVPRNQTQYIGNLNVSGL